MEKDKIFEIAKNPQDHSNKVLVECRDLLIDEHEKTKTLIIDLTRHLDGVEELYDKVNNELGKRTK